MSGDKIFLDTNIIVYAFDTSAGKKREKAADIIASLWDSGLGLISTQVLQEFFVTITTKLPKPLEAGSAREIINDFLKWDVVINDGDIILEAIEIQTEYGYSFWDSMIITAAIKGGADLLYTEDLTDGQKIKGVSVINPLMVRDW